MHLSIAPQLRRDAGLQLLAAMRTVVRREDLHPRELVLDQLERRSTRALKLNDETLGDLHRAELVRSIPTIRKRHHVRPGGAKIARVLRIVRGVDRDAGVRWTGRCRLQQRWHPEAFQLQHQVATIRFGLQQPGLYQSRTWRRLQVGIAATSPKTPLGPIGFASVACELVPSLEVKVSEVLIHFHLQCGELHLHNAGR